MAYKNIKVVYSIFPLSFIKRSYYEHKTVIILKNMTPLIENKLYKK